jgi:hypothetical protein
VRSALMRGLEILSLSADPDDRNYAAVLRSQVAMAGHVLGVQIRVDQARLKARDDNAGLRELLALAKQVEEEIKLLGS